MAYHRATPAWDDFVYDPLRVRRNLRGYRTADVEPEIFRLRRIWVVISNAVGFAGLDRGELALLAPGDKRSYRIIDLFGGATMLQRCDPNFFEIDNLHVHIASPLPCRELISFRTRSMKWRKRCETTAKPLKPFR